MLSRARAGFSACYKKYGRACPWQPSVVESNTFQEHVPNSDNTNFIHCGSIDVVRHCGVRQRNVCRPPSSVAYAFGLGARQHPRACGIAFRRQRTLVGRLRRQPSGQPHSAWARTQLRPCFQRHTHSHSQSTGWAGTRRLHAGSGAFRRLQQGTSFGSHRGRGRDAGHRVVFFGFRDNELGNRCVRQNHTPGQRAQGAGRCQRCRIRECRQCRGCTDCRYISGPAGIAGAA